MTLAQKLRKAREEAGLSISKLALKSGVHKNTIANYETGRTEPSFFNISCIAQVLHISLDELAYGKGNDE